ASYAGARTLVTMKQVGLNVASDPLMSLAYIGVKGGMVILVADDPGPISSQTEQDTRTFGIYSKLPVFDPVSPEEAYQMIQDAFLCSEKLNTPVLFRPTTRVCHGCADINVLSQPVLHKPEGFIKDSSRWVIFPRLSYANHMKIEARNRDLADEFSKNPYNVVTGSGKKGIAAGGISYAYLKEAMTETISQSLPKESEVKLFRVGTPHPFPEKLALSFLEGLEEVLVLEELDPVIEKELIYICGKYHLNVTIKGKLSLDTACAGENSVEMITEYLQDFLNLEKTTDAKPDMPKLPVRPPVLCAGCPHRASFYAVKQAMKGKKAVYSGDIGCYTLGNAMPLDMVDTCLCMGAGITIAQGLHRIEPDTVNFAFVGDSTFFASGMTGVVNAVYNQTDIVLIVLDNSTTAMTGHQVHPGTGKTMMGNVIDPVNIEKILRAIGVESVEIVNPNHLDEAIGAVEAASLKKGVRAIIFKAPCIALEKPKKPLTINENQCIRCKKCIKELGCPAIVRAADGQINIDESLCYGCGICTYVCPVNAIGGNDHE
ncbi:MAG: 4Fe-4S binding protein, partial [Clostridia bacterium]|nr:4Fe-4S binding protein [Clostridia bacterium]